jgi:hypothetical protein
MKTMLASCPTDHCPGETILRTGHKKVYGTTVTQTVRFFVEDKKKLEWNIGYLEMEEEIFITRTNRFLSFDLDR